MEKSQIDSAGMEVTDTGSSYVMDIIWYVFCFFFNLRRFIMLYYKVLNEKNNKEIQGYINLNDFRFLSSYEKKIFL